MLEYSIEIRVRLTFVKIQISKPFCSFPSLRLNQSRKLKKIKKGRERGEGDLSDLDEDTPSRFKGHLFLLSILIGTGRRLPLYRSSLFFSVGASVLFEAVKNISR